MISLSPMKSQNNTGSHADPPKEGKPTRAATVQHAQVADPPGLEEELHKRAHQITHVLEQIPYYRTSTVRWGINE
jgi:hypothetical protein